MYVGTCMYVKGKRSKCPTEMRWSSEYGVCVWESVCVWGVRCYFQGQLDMWLTASQLLSRPSLEFRWGYGIAGYFPGVYISQIFRNDNFREDYTHEVATLGTWVWFSIKNSQKLILQTLAISKYIPHENKPTLRILHFALRMHPEIYE